MKRTNSDMFFSLIRQRSKRLLILFGISCIFLGIFQVSFVLKHGIISIPREGSLSNSKGIQKPKRFAWQILEEKHAQIRPLDFPYRSRPKRKIKELAKTHLSGLNFTAGIVKSQLGIGFFKSANDAVELGRKLWQELELNEKNSSNRGISSASSTNSNGTNKDEECPYSMSVSGDEFSRNRKVIVLQCGLTLGSHITVVGKPRAARVEIKPEISPLKEEQYLMVSEFILELQGLKTVEGEDPPRILHLNPRLKGDWSGKPVIEHNTCYRMQWGTPQRCEGWRTKADEETVDGFVKCEEWIGDDDTGLEESEATWWLNRLIGRTKKVVFNWPFPFSEEKIFVLTISAGLEGFHVNVNGRHVTSFPYHTGFTLEDATGLSLNGDVDVLSIVAASLPTSHPNYDPQKHLELSDRWRAPPIPDRPIELFIGVLSAGNHFAERMAVRKTWMQHELIKSSNVVARFFVALHRRKEVNEEVKKEAEFFGDIVIVPYMDNYDLVVLKTVAIVEYGVRTVLADYIMKGDDDTFIRVDGILDEAKKVQDNRSLYIGNMNFYHQPMRTGKWAVTYEEWPEEVYPPYANGPGYIISSGIAKFILSDFEKHKLQLFKMEDVSMGMWVEKINKTRPVSYVHSLRFCQFGCIEDYITAHYQSPRQMICLWNKLRRQIRPLCCNIR